jgi:hypothetical protein
MRIPSWIKGFLVVARATGFEVRWLVLLNRDVGPAAPWCWGWGLVGACWWRRGGASGCVGLFPVEAMRKQGGAGYLLGLNMW